MGDDNVQLSIISSECISFEKGDKIIIGGNEYTIRTTVNRDLISEDHYQSDAIFYGVMYELMKTQYRDCDANGKSTRSTFDLTYSIKDFVKVIIYNLNRDYPGLWAFDEDNCPDTDPITIQFSKQNCLQVLQSLCSESNFKLEFKISQANGVRTIHIGKFGAKIVPPGGREFFEWGKGNGLYTLKEKKIDDKSIKTRLWIEGGTTNIRADYRNYSERLQLPFPRRLNKHKHTLADGTVIEAESEMIGILNDNDRFIEDADLREALGSDEDTAQYDNIYPRRTGEVTALVEGDINSFVDDTMDFDLTEKDANGTKYLINEVSAKINFISGLLAGQQFELAAYDHSSNTFTLKPYTDNRGLTIPTAETEAYRIRTGDKYTITEINLPKSYEDDAEEELWYAGKEDFDGMKQARAQYDLTLDRKYLIDNTPSDAETSIFNVGDYVPIKDVRFGIEKSIRIQKVVRNLLVDQDYTLTLSDTTKISVAAQTVIDVINHEQIIVNNRLRDLNKARRGWRTTEDLRNMVYDTDGFFDTDNIRPNSIDTNMLTVGSKSQQFVLTDVILQANVGGLPNRFDASAGVLSHLTINDDAIMHWNMGASEFTLGSPGGYYLFAKCSKSGNTGVWFLTQQQLRFEPEDDPNNYYFQVGILSPLREGDNFRDFVTTYGFTRINGNTITTGKIVTSDGECYLDLDGNKFRIGDRSSSIDWNVSRNNTITLKNVSVISESGDVAPLGVYRGVWNVNYTYYKNDEVSYTDEKGAIATYRYIHNTPTKGHKPTESVYWGVVAKGIDGVNGDDGKNGDFTEYRYAVSGGKLSHGKAFTASDRNPGSDWTTVMPSVGSLQYLWLTTAKINGETNALRANWTTPIRVTPYDGVDGTPGKDGDVGPALVFRGIYSSSKSYVGSDKRVDVVKYNNHYYVARTDAGTFYNVLPTNTAKWNDFGSEFETIATGFLFAENANIANLIFRNERLESQSQTNGVPNFFLDGLKNIASFGAGSAVFDGASAKLGWLNIVGRELLGFDDDGIQRLRLTPSSLPSVGSASSHEDVIIKATGGDATYTGTTNWEVRFEEDVWCYYGRDDHEDDMHDSLYAYIEFDIAEDNTLLDLSSIQFSCGVKRINSTQYEWLDCSLSATAFLKVGTQWQTIGSVSLKDSSTAKITIPKKGRIKVSFNGTIDQTLYIDYSGKFTFVTQAIWAITAKTEMIIAKDGFMAIYNANYLRMHSTDGLAVKIGNYHFRVTSSDISVSKNGTSWTKLIT